MIVFLIVGIVFLIVGIIMFITSRNKKLHCTNATTGKVIDIIKDVSKNYSTNGNGTNYTGPNIRVGDFSVGVGNANYRTTFYPVIEYIVEGNKYIKRLNNGSSTPTYGIGQEIEVHYNAENPNEYYVGTGMANSIAGIVFSVLGILFIAIFAIVQIIL